MTFWMYLACISIGFTLRGEIVEGKTRWYQAPLTVAMATVYLAIGILS